MTEADVDQDRANDVVAVLDGLASGFCLGCDLRESCKTRGHVGYEEPTKRFSGLMIVGEGPGQTELKMKRPFVGPAGKLLDALLEAADIDRETCLVANATMCMPPYAGNTAKPEGFTKRFPKAVHSCLPHLEAAMAKWRQRVVLCLGQTALEAAVGYEVKKGKQTAIACERCDPKDRKIGPVLACAVGDCGWYVELGGSDPEAVKLQHGHACPKCTANLKRLRPKRMKCPDCGGRRVQVHMETLYKSDHKISWVAGGVFHAGQLPAHWDEFGVRYVVSTFHPSFVLRKASTKGAKQIGGQFVAFAVVAHMQKALRLLSQESTWKCDVIVTDDPAEVDAYTAEETLYAVDIETDNKNPEHVTRIDCVGIARQGTHETLVVDTRTADKALWDAIRRFLENERKKKVLQNRLYDELVFQYRHRILTRGTIGDTMYAMHALYPDEGKDLHKIGFRYTDVTPWKPPKTKDGKQVFATEDDLFIYNGRDSRVTVESWPPLEAEMIRYRVKRVHDLDLRMADIAMDMQAAGMPISRERLGKIGDQVTRDANDALKTMRAMLDREDFNPQAVKQVEAAVFGPASLCKQKAVTMTKGGAASTAKSILERMAHPFIRELLRYRKNQKILRTYIDAQTEIIGPDGRMHIKWSPHGAVTGRWSSSPNAQNIPVEPINLRWCVVAPPGRKLIGADFAQLELRIMAALSGDAELIKRCANANEERKLEPEHDPHSYVASMTFGVGFTGLSLQDPEQKRKRKHLRDLVKRVIYGLNYGAGAATVLDAIYAGGYEGPPISLELLQKVMQTYFKLFPGVVPWREGVLQEAQRTKEVRSPILGRRRVFPLGDVDVTVAYNYPIQSGAADIMNERLLVLYETMEQIDPSSYIIAQVHDAVYLECAEDRAQAVADHVTQTLTNTRVLVKGAPSMPFPATAKIGDDWAEVS